MKIHLCGSKRTVYTEFVLLAVIIHTYIDLADAVTGEVEEPEFSEVSQAWDVGDEIISQCDETQTLQTLQVLYLLYLVLKNYNLIFEWLLILFVIGQGFQFSPVILLKYLS